MKIKTFFMMLLLSSSLMHLSVSYAADGHDHDNEEKTHSDNDAESEGEHDELAGEDSHDEEGIVSLTLEQIRVAGILVESLQPELISSVIKAPGEVKLNTYKTASVSPRITAQVISSHVKLGETVRIGQPVATLSSVEMADAQGALLLADREWKRVKKLGQKVVSDSRYTKAKVYWELAKGKARAYGMSEDQIKKLLSSKDFSLANGRFDLIANHEGTVLTEDYILGQQVESGHELFRITNESSLWVVVNVSPLVDKQVSIGNKANVYFGEEIIPAVVIQKYHSLDKVTRTTGVRLEVNNPKELLHPGMFVNAVLETSLQSKALTLPEAAVLRSSDGDWEVMVEQDEEGEFKAVEVDLLRVTDGIAIIEGIKAGVRVVTQGAFFVQSELAKSGFDIHNH